MSAENHINESILNDEIREHQRENRIDHMTYLPDMEDIGSEVMDKVIAEMDRYDYDSYTEAIEAYEKISYSEKSVKGQVSA